MLRGHSRTLAHAVVIAPWRSPQTGCTVDSVNAEHIVVREPTEVMLVRVADELSEIQRAWASFEAAVGLRGRKFYGAFDPVTAATASALYFNREMIPPILVRSVGRSPAGVTHVSVSTASLQVSTRRSGRLRSASRNGLTPITHARPWSTTAVTISSMSSCRSSDRSSRGLAQASFPNTGARGELVSGGEDVSLRDGTTGVALVAGATRGADRAIAVSWLAQDSSSTRPAVAVGVPGLRRSAGPRRSTTLAS